MSVTTIHSKSNCKKLKHILVDENNYEQLRDLGRTRDSFNDVITRLLTGEVQIERKSTV